MCASTTFVITIDIAMLECPLCTNTAGTSANKLIQLCRLNRERNICLAGTDDVDKGILSRTHVPDEFESLPPAQRHHPKNYGTGLVAVSNRSAGDHLEVAWSFLIRGQRWR